VGVIVQPSSKVITLDAEGTANCASDRPLIVSETSDTDVVYTYNVEWIVLILQSPLLTIDFFDEMGYTMG
jgi:hypothetical protein